MRGRYAGDAEGKGGIYNFVTKRGLCHGKGAKISWTQARVVLFACLPGCLLAGFLCIRHADWLGDHSAVNRLRCAPLTFSRADKRIPRVTSL